jgi:predicted nucleic acid-binding protein
MEQCLIDTNIVSDYLSGSLPDSSSIFMNSAIDAVPILSVITQIKLLWWKTLIVTEQHVRNFIGDCTILDIDSNVIDQCVMLRKGKKIKLPDALIAATASANGYTIITKNDKDFLGIKDLKVINPYKLL